MIKKASVKLLTFLLAALMIFGMLPLSVFAEGETDTTTETTTETVTEPTYGSVTNYADFIANLKDLEVYAATYAEKLFKDPGELVLNFIRTGVDRYQDDNWETLAGVEDVGFTIYVEEQDAANGTTAMNLKDIVIDNFTIPNGNQVDFGHMFGCMNISYVNKGSADLSGWSGDICDLLQYCVQLNSDKDVTNDIPDGTIDELAAYIQEKCFGVSASGAFGWDDFWGDMDAYYLVSEYKKANGEKTFSELMEAYFEADTDGDGVVDDGEYTGADGLLTLSDVDRTVYFMNNRFAVADSPEAVRKAIFEAYSSDVSIKILESTRGLSSYIKLREACCYAVADYIYSQAGNKGLLIEGTVSDDTAENGYYTVFSTEHSILAPGVEQDIKYAQTVDGKQIVYYVATVDVNREDLTIMVNYKDNKPPVAGEHIGLQRVDYQVDALIKNHEGENFYPIVATNGAGYNITNGTPSGLVFMQGVEYYPANAPGFFAILKDGTAMIGTKEEYEANKAQIQEGIQAFGHVLVKDGAIAVTKNANYTSSRASRTAIGIKADGSVVMMVLDGRQLPFSAGGSIEEIAQIMLEAGCVDAVNLDGGGSTTYMSKPAGSDKIQVVNRPSDGMPRSVSTSLVAVSTAAPSTAFDHAIIESDYEYITAGTSMQFSVTGVSNTGNAAIIPEGSYWRVSDENIGIIDENGLFKAVANGTVDVEYIVNGEVKGSKVIHVVVPDDIKFAESSMSAIYGVSKKINVTVWYQGNAVAFTPLKDAFVFFDYEFNEYGEPILYFTSDAGYIDGLEFVGSADKYVRTATIYCAIMVNGTIKADMSTVSLYYENEATFDFENATFGNRTLAWYREISNTHTFDDMLYRVSDKDTPVEMEYTFALDMKAIDIPPRLEPMIFKLPTYQEGATAWDYMLQMANRVCEQTKVTITVDFSQDVEVDISELKVVNQFFELTSADLDENNHLVIVCNWIYQSAAIAPSMANSLCLLTGIKTTLKDTAKFYNDEVVISNNGTVAYDVYLAASSLKSFVDNPENDAQRLYGLYPYTHEPACRIDGDSGAYFSNVYADFADTYVITTEELNGWHEDYYYKDNVPVTGVQLVPHRNDPTKLYFYEFGADGKIVSETGMNGLIPFEGDLYYAVLGVAQTGWQQIDNKNYYFNPDTGKALNGSHTLRESLYPGTSDTRVGDYKYTFTDYVLTEGDLVYGMGWVSGQGNIYGYRYRWAGKWAQGWFDEVEGKVYLADSHSPYFLKTGFVRVVKQNATSTSDTQYHLFSETGEFQKDYNGVYFDGTNYHYLKNGVRVVSAGLYEDNGYYYYVNGGNGTIYVNQTDFEVNDYWGRGYVPSGKYNFDQYGRLSNPLISNVENKTNTEIITEIIGRVMTIKTNTDAKVCRIVCKDSNGKYVMVESMINPYASAVAAADGEAVAIEYNFAVPQGATDVQIMLSGDVETNGVVDNQDVQSLYNSIIGKDPELTGAASIAADVNGDGKLTTADVAKLNAAIKNKVDLDW